LTGRGRASFVHGRSKPRHFLKNNPGTDEKPHGAFIAFTDGTV
jgi:predicted flavoprotein YhiN